MTAGVPGKRVQQRQTRPFLPAARFKALTPYFDAFLGLSLPELRFKRQLLGQLEVTGQARVLDLGVGTATLAIWIKQRFPQATVVGVDPDPQILNLARQKIRESGADVDLVEAFADKLPIEDASVDVIVSTLVFHHLTGAQKASAVSEVARVLRPGGRLHVGDWGKPRGLLQELLFIPARIFDGFAVTADNRRGALPHLFSAAGLTEVRLDAERKTAFGTLALYSARKPALVPSGFGLPGELRASYRARGGHGER